MAVQTARLNALTNRWPWRVAARVAFERPAGAFEGFGARQTAGLNALKNRWPWPVAERVALERRVEGLEGFGAWSKGLRERLKGLGPGKRQA